MSIIFLSFFFPFFIFFIYFSFDELAFFFLYFYSHLSPSSPLPICLTDLHYPYLLLPFCFCRLASASGVLASDGAARVRGGAHSACILRAPPREPLFTSPSALARRRPGSEPTSPGRHPATALGGCDRWVSLQYVQYHIYFYNT
jgi:hypothetical protein